MWPNFLSMYLCAWSVWSRRFSCVRFSLTLSTMPLETTEPIPFFFPILLSAFATVGEADFLAPAFVFACAAFAILRRAKRTTEKKVRGHALLVSSRLRKNKAPRWMLQINQTRCARPTNEHVCGAFVKHENMFAGHSNKHMLESWNLELMHSYSP